MWPASIVFGPTCLKGGSLFVPVGEESDCSLYEQCLPQTKQFKLSEMLANSVLKFLANKSRGMAQALGKS